MLQLLRLLLGARGTLDHLIAKHLLLLLLWWLLWWLHMEVLLLLLLLLHCRLHLVLHTLSLHVCLQLLLLRLLPLLKQLQLLQSLLKQVTRSALADWRQVCTANTSRVTAEIQHLLLLLLLL